MNNTLKTNSKPQFLIRIQSHSLFPYADPEEPVFTADHHVPLGNTNLPCVAYMTVIASRSKCVLT